MYSPSGVARITLSRNSNEVMTDMLGHLAFGEAASAPDDGGIAFHALKPALSNCPRNNNDSGAPRRPELTGHPIDALRACPAVVYRMSREGFPKRGVDGQSPPGGFQSRGQSPVHESTMKRIAHSLSFATTAEVCEVNHTVSRAGGEAGCMRRAHST
jgi:hypothetical protein